MRFGEGRAERYAASARELIDSRVDAVFAYGTPALTALQAVTDSVPVVAVVSDLGVSRASSDRPTRNVTGLSTLSNELIAKRLALLKELAPAIGHVAYLGSSSNPVNANIEERLRRAADPLRLKFTFADAKSNDLDAAFDALVKAGAEAIVLAAEPSFFEKRAHIVAWIASRRLPAIYPVPEYSAIGGLMTYAPDYRELGRRAARFVDRILGGARPDDLPIQQAEKFELILNQKTANVLGIQVPPTFLARADEVIE